MSRLTPVFLLTCLGGAFALFAFTLCGHLPPGTDAHTLAGHLGVSPFAPVDSPLWGLWVKACSRLGPDGFRALNAGNAVLGAIAVALVARLALRLPRDRTHEERRSQLAPVRAATLSAVVAAVALATTPAFWYAATRATPDLTGLVLLLVAALLWLQALEKDRFRELLLGCLLLGVGCVEYATFFLALPLFALLVAAHSLRRRRVRWGRVGACLLCFLLGYTLVFYAAQIVWRSPSAAWRGYEHFGDALWAVFRQQKVMLVRSVPQVGWLLLALFSLLPLLAVLLPKERLQRSTRWPSYALHLGLTALAGLFLANSWLSLYGQFRLHLLTLAPAAVNALWIGYLAGYWWSVFHSHSRMESAGGGALKRGLAHAWPALIAAGLCLVGWRNANLVHPRHTAWTDAYAEALLEALPDHALFATDGPVDGVVLLKAAQRGKPLRLLNPRYAAASNYIGYMGTLWSEPRVRSLVGVGPMAALAEWVQVAPEAASAQFRSDFYDAPLHTAAWEAVPRAPFYEAVPYGEEVDLDALAAALQAWADRPFWPAALDEEAPDAYHHLRHWLRLSSAKLANNLGVLSERHQRLDLAEAHYRLARRWNPDNVSALLNLADLAPRQAFPDADAIAKDLQEFLAKLQSGLRLLSLSHVHGQIARPEAFVERGLSWAVSGRPGVGAAEIQRALQLSRQNEELRLMLAFLQIEQGEGAAAEPVIREALARDPANATALAQLARLEAARGDFDSARNALARALEAQPESSTLRLQQVGLDLLAEDWIAARDRLKDITRRPGGNLQAWALLALVSHQLGDADGVRRAEDHLRHRDDLTTSIRMVLADLHRRRSDFTSARRLLEEALTRDRTNPLLHDQLLRVLYFDRDLHRAREVTTQLLRLDPAHAFGNLMQGSIQYADGDLEFAEASFRASIRSAPSAEAYNSLAFVLALRGRHSEAEPLAHQALALNPGDPSALDTLSVIELGLGRLAEAQAHARAAVAGAPGHPEMLLQLARVLDRTPGGKPEALSICNDLFDRIATVPARRQTEVADLRARLASEVGGARPAPSQ